MHKLVIQVKTVKSGWPNYRFLNLHCVLLLSIPLLRRAEYLEIPLQSMGNAIISTLKSKLSLLSPYIWWFVEISETWKFFTKITNLVSISRASEVFEKHLHIIWEISGLILNNSQSCRYFCLLQMSRIWLYVLSTVFFGPVESLILFFIKCTIMILLTFKKSLKGFENKSSPTGFKQIIFVCEVTELHKCVQNWELCKVPVNALNFFLFHS